MGHNQRIAVYTGSFDPFHLGHENVIRRAARLVDKLVVGVGVNPEKREVFSPQERVEMMREVLADLDNVDIKAFTGLTVEFVRGEGAHVLLRGIRALADIEYEFTMSMTNSCLDASIETVFLMAQKEYTHLSSTLIRQIAEYGGDLKGFVPDPIVHRLMEKFRRHEVARASR